MKCLTTAATCPTLSHMNHPMSSKHISLNHLIPHSNLSQSPPSGFFHASTPFISLWALLMPHTSHMPYLTMYVCYRSQITKHVIMQFLSSLTSLPTSRTQTSSSALYPRTPEEHILPPLCKTNRTMFHIPCTFQIY